MKKYTLFVLLIISLFLFCGCQNVMFKNTTVNGVDISGMSTEMVGRQIKNIANEQKNKINITLKHQEKVYTLNGSDFELKQDFSKKVFKKMLPNTLEKLNLFNNKKNNIEFSNNELIEGLEEKIDEIALQIDCQSCGGDISLNQENQFVISEICDGYIVNKQLLKEQIMENLSKTCCFELEIPTIPKTPNITYEDIQKNLQLRSEYSTDYTSSTDGRKQNVQLALSAFNGLKVEPNQEISFNDVLASKIDESQFKTAKVILNGEFVDGKGGGVCQASTTLYNALILSDLEILEVHSHSLPVNYVPLAFDAMVNQGSADLKFKNNLQHPIYLKTWGDDKKAHVEVWGQPFEEGKTIRTRADFVGTLPHPGDKIVADTEGKYLNKITFKGEYVRAKLPQEGYESKAVIEYLENGEVVDEKTIRHERYQSQYGIIYEGVEDLIDGITLPENNVKFIPPQQSSHSNQDIVNNKIKNSR